MQKNILLLIDLDLSASPSPLGFPLNQNDNLSRVKDLLKSETTGERSKVNTQNALLRIYYLNKWFRERPDIA